MPYAGQNVNSFKKSSIPDPADIGEKKACGFRENFFCLHEMCQPKNINSIEKPVPSGFKTDSVQSSSNYLQKLFT